VLLEHPDDPGAGYASIWAMPEVCEWEARLHTTRLCFDQCMTGGAAVKPTCVSTTLQGLDALNGLRCDGSHQHVQAYGRNDDGGFRSTILARYPQPLCRILADGVLASVRARKARLGNLVQPFKRSTCWSRRAVDNDDAATAVLNEDVPTGRHVMLSSHQNACYLHVDDGVFFSSSDARFPAPVAMSGAAAEMEDVGSTFQIGGSTMT